MLFACVHNAGRPQMAAALLNHRAHDRVHVRSVGSAPVEEIDPAVATVMAEIGIDLSANGSGQAATADVNDSDVIITMGCEGTCPIYPGKRYLDWNLPGPAGLTAAEIRPIRDAIEAKAEALLAELPAN